MTTTTEKRVFIAFDEKEQSVLNNFINLIEELIGCMDDNTADYIYEKNSSRIFTYDELKNFKYDLTRLMNASKNIELKGSCV